MGLLYVDKTRRIFDLAPPKNRFVFLARPRRFGKSLLASTLEALFQGDRALCAGTWIHDSAWDWTPHAVIRLDMSALRIAGEASLEAVLTCRMGRLFVAWGETPPGVAPADWLLEALIRQLAARRPIVALNDEYDAPILQNLEKRAELTGLRDVLRGFYGALKANSRHLRFVFLTGATRFARISIFAGLNNLRDISHLPEFSDLGGLYGSGAGPLSDALHGGYGLRATHDAGRGAARAAPMVRMAISSPRAARACTTLFHASLPE